MRIGHNVLTKETFKKWGDYVAAGDVDNQTQNEAFNHVPDIAVFDLDGPISASILEPKKRENVLTCMERHDKTPEMCVALEHDCIIAVAMDKDGKPDETTVETYLLKQGDTVIYHPGVWHWVPYAVNTDTCKHLIVYKYNTGKNDFFMEELYEKIYID